MRAPFAAASPLAAQQAHPQAAAPALSMAAPATATRADGLAATPAFQPASTTLSSSTLHPGLLPASVPPTRADAAQAERALMQPGGTVPGSLASASTPAAHVAGAAAGNPQAVNPMPAQAAPASLAPGEARGNTMMTAGGPERGGSRTDGGQPHGHTVTGVTRRRTREDGTGRGLHAAAATPGPHQRHPDPESEIQEEASRVFQWLYWILTFAAYACLAMAVVIVLPILEGGAAPPTRDGPLAWIALLAGIGACAGVGAWWLARRRQQ